MNNYKPVQIDHAKILNQNKKKVEKSFIQI